MKTIQLIVLAVFAAVMFSGCGEDGSKTSASQEVVKADNIQVYYFHYTRRCATCEAVEKVAKETVSGLNNPKVTFESFNLQLNAGKDKSKEIGVSGQALVIKAGEAKFDITNEAFLQARNNPEKLKQLMTEKIQACL